MSTSKASSRSVRSSVSLKRKESLVKLKLAKLAKEAETKRVLDEQSAANVRRKAAEAKRVTEALERELRLKEKDREIELAAEEVRAWDEVSIGSLGVL